MNLNISIDHNHIPKVNELYGIYSNIKGRTNLLLRVCLDFEIAKLYTPNTDRRIELITLKR